MAEHSLSFDMALKELAGLLHRIALQQGLSDADDEARVKELAGRLSPEEVQLYYQIAILGRRDLVLAPDEEAGFGMTMLRMLAFAPANGAATQVAEPVPARLPKKQITAPAVPPAALGADFDGDWNALVSRLNLTGMAGMLAKQCELVSYENNILELTVAEEHKHLLSKSYQDKLKSELAPHLPPGLRINIRAGKLQGKSVAAAEKRELDVRQAKAVASIEGDAFVRELVSDFGAQLDPAAIKPVS